MQQKILIQKSHANCAFYSVKWLFLNINLLPQPSASPQKPGVKSRSKKMFHAYLVLWLHILPGT